jgi:hypothetical protein
MSREEEAKDGAGLLVAGLGLGAYGAVSLAVAGAVCPVCVVAAPALVGAGLWKRWRASRMERPDPPEDAEAGGEP